MRERTAHRDLFARLRVVNRDLVWLNLLFLLPVSLIPFAASVLGKYPDEPVAAVGRRVHRPSRPRTHHHGGPDWPVPLGRRRRIDNAQYGALLLGPVLYFILVTVLREHPSTRSEPDDFT